MKPRTKNKSVAPAKQAAAAARPATKPATRAAKPAPAKTSPNSNSKHAAILAVVARIPRGRLASYGQIAALAGLPRQARLVGYALHQAGDAVKLPWHRVVNASGGLSFPADSEVYAKQRQRLEAEGIVFIGGRADWSRYRWTPQSAAPLLD